MSDKFAPGDVVRLYVDDSNRWREMRGVSIYSQPCMNIYTVTKMKLEITDFVIVVGCDLFKFADDGVEYDTPMAYIIAGDKIGWVPETWLAMSSIGRGLT